MLLPSFVSPKEQKELVRWSLRDQARHPNETNLDTHYTLPKDGLWNAHLTAMQDPSSEALVQPRLSSELPSASDHPGPRKLIDNTPAAPDNFITLSTSFKTPAMPSPTALLSPPSALLPRLRWANIGWTYHWGSKQYNFSKGRVEVDPQVHKVCKSAVGVVDWSQVFGPGDNAQADGWGEAGPDWLTWDDTYGIYFLHGSHHCDNDLSQSQMQALSTFTKPKWAHCLC